MTATTQTSSMQIIEFTDEQRAGLRDYWDVYQACRDEMTKELMESLSQHAELAPLIASQTEAEQKAESEASDERTRKAIFENDWVPYWDTLRTQGAMYAKGAISFSTWLELLIVFRNATSKRLVTAYHNDPDRLIRCLDAFNVLTGNALAVLGDTYLTAKQEIIEEQAVARTKAEGANAAKDEFLSRMSHELRTPLNAVVGFGQVLARDDLTDDQKDSVAQILKAGKMLLELINEILDISRITTGKISLSLEPVSVQQAMTEATELLRPLAAAEGINLHVQQANGLHVRADRQRLKQVLVNLIANAIKYNRPEGMVMLTWETTEKGRVRLNVADTGHGIPPSRIARLFQPFERLGAESGDVEGTGLGLALSKGLVEAMEGTLTATSELSKGSTFTIDMALTEPPHEVGTSAKPARAGSSQHAEYTLLYIEDNVSNLRLVQRILAERPEVALISAMQGRMGVTLAAKHLPTVILLDLHLPDISGEDVLRQLNELEETRDIPVVVMSADASPGRIERLLDAGADAYLTKPLDIEQFLKAIDAACAASAR